MNSWVSVISDGCKGNKHGHLVSNFHRNTIQKKGRIIFSALKQTVLSKYKLLAFRDNCEMSFVHLC